ncbi:MAG: type I-A CRISPR-associated protein Cas7/Csa2, partial [Sulfolobus sp.]|nr:type I-A CRISPR-associated protein Cas7/Csa2 [Sulfolobus sp.]
MSEERRENRTLVPYVRVSGVMEIQLSALTGYGNIGNYNAVATANILVNNQIYEVPVITGNTMKHWHAYYLANIYSASGGRSLNTNCMAGIGDRGKNLNNENASNDCDAIQDLCNDIHGYLITTGTPRKKDSLVKTAFVIPLLTDENVKNVAKFAVTHNRVSREQMMVFKNEYATATYGFNILMDLDKVGKDYLGNSCQGINEDEVKLRMRSAVLALSLLFSGVGSKQARALPIVDLKELVIVVADKPIPNAVHGAYPNYAKETYDIIRRYSNYVNANVHFFVYPRTLLQGISDANIHGYDVYTDAIGEAANYVI